MHAMHVQDSTIGSTGFEKGIVVSNGGTRWFLVLQTEHEKTEWTAAIMAHIQERRRYVFDTCDMYNPTKTGTSIVVDTQRPYETLAYACCGLTLWSL
jgi:hypothetical protein